MITFEPFLFMSSSFVLDVCCAAPPSPYSVALLARIKIETMADAEIADVCGASPKATAKKSSHPVAEVGDAGVAGKKGSDKQGSDAKGSDKKGSDKKASDKKASDKKASDKKASDKKGSDKKGSGKKGSGKKGSGKKGSVKKGSGKKVSAKRVPAKGKKKVKTEEEGEEEEAHEDEEEEEEEAEEDDDAMKRPAAAEEEETEEDDDAMKRPAAARRPSMKRPAVARSCGRYMKKRPAAAGLAEEEGIGENKYYGDGDISKTSTGQEMRDPIKAKKFFAMLHAGTLPDNLKAAYEGAAIEKGTNTFESQTKVINRGVKRVGIGTLVVQSNHPFLTLLKAHVKTGYQDEFHAGMIYEEAKKACGSFEDLKAAVYGNRVTTAGDSPHWEELTYYFKRSAVGSKEEAKKTVTATKKEKVSQETWDKFSAAVDAFIPQTGHVTGSMGTGVSALAFVASQGNGTPSTGWSLEEDASTSTVSVEADTTSLQERQKKLESAVRCGEKVIEGGLALPSKHERLAFAIQKLVIAQEEAEIQQTRNRFALKYKKDMVTKSVITSADVETMDSSTIVIMQDLAAKAVLLKHEMKESNKE